MSVQLWLIGQNETKHAANFLGKPLFVAMAAAKYDHPSCLIRLISNVSRRGEGGDTERVW